MKGIIIFTDIVNSSILWNKYQLLFLKIIKKINNLINKIVKEKGGIVIKTIGDSSMIYFNKKKRINSLEFILNLIENFKEKPFIINNEKILIRIGCSYGDIQKTKEKIQNCDVLDYYGENVNIASRMESKISIPGGFAIHNFSYENIKDKLPKKFKIFIKKNFKIKNIKFKNLTFKKNLFKRSGKMKTSFKHQLNKYNIINLKSVVNFIPN